MGYLVLARKWRPQTFDDLVGQGSIARVLRNAIEQNRIAHAYLFSGPRGVGKTSTARILSKALNCAEGPTVAPCGLCDSCRSVTDGSSVDVIEIDGASNNSVEDIRDLREKVKYAPSSGRYKVYIIDEAHMLSQSAFNALLKTLEEPPPHVVFVLATTAPNKIPVTVLSRCQHLPFRRIPAGIIRERLENIISNEKEIGITAGALDMLARAADGSMRDALTLLDQVVAFSQDIAEDDIRTLLGISDSSLVIDMISAVISGDRGAVINITARVYESGLDIKDFMKTIINTLRNMLVCRVLGSADAVAEFSDAERERVEEIIASASEEYLTLLLETLVKAEYETRLSAFPRIAMEMALLKASLLSRFRDIGALISRFGSGGPAAVRDRVRKNAGQAGGAPAVDRPSAREDEVSARPARDTDDVWPLVVKKINDRDHVLACKLDLAEVELKDDTLSVIFNGGSSIHAESVKKQRALIEDAATEVAARKIRVVVDTKKKVKPAHEDIRERILNDPFVKEALELFDGRIVDIRPRSSDSAGRQNT